MAEPLELVRSLRANYEQAMDVIDGHSRTREPFGDEVVAAVVELVAERDRLRADYESLWSVMERVGQELDRILGDGDLGPDVRAALLETVSLNVNLVLGVGAEDDE